MRTKLLICLFCVICAFSLAACGGGNDTAREPDGTAVSDEASPPDGEAQPEETEGQQTDGEQEPAQPQDTGESGPSVDYTGPVPSQDEAIAMKDSEISCLLSGTPREEILSAWGEPDMKYDAESDFFDADEWMLLETTGIHYIDVHYDGSGNVSDVCIRGTGGGCSADITEFDNGQVWKAGLERKFWADGPSEDGFEAWCAEQTDANLILGKFQSAGLTRHTVRELLDEPCGHWYSKNYVYQGDVFSVWTDYESDPDKNQFVCVLYDGSNLVVPVAVGLYPAEGPDGDWYISPPFTDMEAIYVDGIYDSREEPPAQPQDVEFDAINTWYKN